MKLAAVFFIVLEIFQIYRLSKSRSTAIEVSSVMVPSWIRILVRPIKKSVIQILLMSKLHLDLYSELCTIEVETYHISGTHSIYKPCEIAQARSVLQSEIRCHHVVWRDGDSSTALLERKCSFNNFRNLFYSVGTDYANYLYTFRVSRRGNGFFLFFSSLLSLIDILITSVDSI